MLLLDIANNPTPKQINRFYEVQFKMAMNRLNECNIFLETYLLMFFVTLIRIRVPKEGNKHLKFHSIVASNQWLARLIIVQIDYSLGYISRAKMSIRARLLDF